MFYVREGEKFNINKQHKIAGVGNFPKGWFKDQGNRSRSGVTEGAETVQPNYNPVLQRVAELPLVEISGVWTEQWDVEELYSTQPEIDAAVAADLAQQAEATRVAELEATLDLDTTLNNFKGMSNAEFNTWWSANVTNAAQAIGVLKRLARLMIRRVL